MTITCLIDTVYPRRIEFCFSSCGYIVCSCNVTVFYNVIMYVFASDVMFWCWCHVVSFNVPWCTLSVVVSHCGSDPSFDPDEQLMVTPYTSCCCYSDWCWWHVVVMSFDVLWFIPYVLALWCHNVARIHPPRSRGADGDTCLLSRQFYWLILISVSRFLLISLCVN